MIFSLNSIYSILAFYTWYHLQVHIAAYVTWSAKGVLCLFNCIHPGVASSNLTCESGITLKFGLLVSLGQHHGLVQ